MKKFYTVENWISYWLDTYQSIKLKSSCMDSYKSILRTHIAPYIGSIQLISLTSEDIQKMYLQLSKCGRFDGKGGLSAKTIINVHRLLNNALKNAVIYGEIDKNPCDLVVLPKYNRTVMRCLTLEEQKKILNAVKNSYYAPVFSFALQTGLRLGEVMGLTWNDVDFFNRVITVSHTLKRVNVFGEDKKTKLQFSSPKTSNSYRQIPLTDSLYNLLFEQHKRKSLMTNQVFCNTKGTLCGPRYIEQYIQNVCKRLNFKGVSFHTLRHSFATTCLQADIPIKTVSELLGHSTVQITVNVRNPHTNKM